MKMRRLFFIFLLFLLPVIVLSQTTWYIDNAQTSGDNSGTSWNNAWTSFAAIQWDSVNPGDTLYISGGTDQKVYNEQLYIKKSGSENAPITFKVGQTSPHNGKVIITNNGQYGGVVIARKAYITIDGQVGTSEEKKIAVQNCGITGMEVYSCHHILLTHLDINNNGNASDEDGIRIYIEEYIKPNIEISYCDIHNNWQDQIKGLTACIAPGFGHVIIHHNRIFDVNDDGFECGLGGVDFYNNEVYHRSYDGGVGHPDAICILGGEYYRIYNNTFHDFHKGNSYIVVETYYKLKGTAADRPSKDIYIFNNLFYEETIVESDGDNYLRGISFVPQIPCTPSITNVVIANNTLVNIPAWGLIVKLNNLNLSKLQNIIVANNIIHNCFTVGGGTGMIIDGLENMSIVNSSLTKSATPVLKNFLIGALSFFPVACHFGELNPTTSLGERNIIITNNCISAGTDGSNYIGINGAFLTFTSALAQVNVRNFLGITNDPGLSADFKPDEETDLVVNAGEDIIANLNANYNIDFLDIFTSDLEGNERPSGEWDIGAFEYNED